MGARVIVGVSLKAYFGHRQAQDWFASVASIARTHPGVRDGRVELFVLPTFVQLASALEAFAGTRVQVGAQDVAATGPGAFTGEVTAAELAEIGASIGMAGHAERRRVFGESDAIVAAKTVRALESGLTPLLCVGETREGDDAAATTTAQLERALEGAPPGRVLVAYEPVWAIGAAEPATVEHVASAAAALRAALDADPARAGSAVLYGGSAGPGLLARLGTAVDGVFLGRFAHDPAALERVLDEAFVLTTRAFEG